MSIKYRENKDSAWKEIPGLVAKPDYDKVQQMIDAIPATDLSNYYNKTETYSKTEVDEQIANAAGGTVDLSNYYTKTEAYNKTEVDDAVDELNQYLTAANQRITDLTGVVNLKAASADVYTKTEADAKIDEKIADIQISDLTNYYNKGEVDAAIGNINKLSKQIVTQLPTGDIDTNTIYLIKEADSNNYSQNMYIGGQWANLGSTSVDLTEYYTKTQADTKIDEKIAAIPATDLSNYYNKTEIDAKLVNVPTTGSSNGIHIGPNQPDADSDAVLWIPTT